MIIKCSKCNNESDSNNFDKRKGSKTGFSYWCKDCRRAYLREYQTRRRKEDPNYVLMEKKAKQKYLRSQYGQKQEKFRKQRYRSSQENKQKELEYGRKYYYEHKEKRVKAACKWNKENPERAKEHAKRASRKRRSNPIYQLADRIRRSIKKVCRKKGLCQNGTTFELLGYTPQQVFDYLKNYLNNPCEECKKTSITLSNSHLDHIKPICTANCLNEVIVLNEMKNLRLICGPCNIKKGAQYEHP